MDGVSVDGMSSSGSGVVRLHPPFLRPSARRSWDSRLALPVPLLMTVSPSSRTQRSSAARISGSCSSAAFFACCDAADGVADGGVVLLASFFSIFLQGFIWLENLIMRRKRGIEDEGRGPAHLSCCRRGRRGGQGTDGGGGKGLLGEEK